MNDSAMSTARVAVLIGCVVCLGVAVLGTVATIYFASPANGDSLDIYKVGGTWLIVGAIVGRVAYNLRSDKAKTAAERR